jgi:cytochrome oxidase Cu insertion factor (SCO1/SenC/PrrC family)
VTFLGVLFALPIGRSLARALPAAPPLLGQVEPFELTDQYDHVVGTEQLRGRLWVVAFLPPAGDPAYAGTVETVRNVIHRTKNLGAMFHMITLPTDPEHATEAERRTLVEKYCSSSMLWSYLGGTPEQVERAKNAILSSLGAGPSDQLLLVDSRGGIRGVYATDKPSVDRLMQDTSYVANLP